MNPSRDWSPRLIPSCKLYRGPVPATGPCDESLRLVPSCVATLMFQQIKITRMIKKTENITFLISRPRTSNMIDSCVSFNDGVFGVRVGMEVSV